MTARMNTETIAFSRILFVVGSIVFASGCGDDVTHQPIPTSSPTQETMGRPPAQPENAAMPDGPGAVFAMSNLRLGRNAPNGAVDSNVWKAFGYNLDFTVTMKSSAGVMLGEETCVRASGASLTNITDGNEGRDNAFGSTVMQLIQGLNADVEVMTNGLIQDGNHSLLFEVAGLGDARSYQALTARIYSAGTLVDGMGMPIKPAWDGNDAWPVAAESVSEGMLNKPLVASVGGYVAPEGLGGTFVGQYTGAIDLPMQFENLPENQGMLFIRIHEPLVTLRFSADRMNVEEGMIAGFIDAAELAQEGERVLGIFDQTLCNSFTSQSIRTQLQQSVDILRGGTKDKLRACDSISIGIQFEASRAKIGAVADPAPAAWNPCAPL